MWTCRVLSSFKEEYFMKKIAVLTSGGDAPGMNAAIASVLNMCDVELA